MSTRILNSREMLILMSILSNGDAMKTVSKISDRYQPTEADIALLDKELHRVEKDPLMGIITILDPAFPAWLKQIVLPPLVLYYRGNINLLTNSLRPLVSIIGSRDPQVYSESHIRNMLPKDCIVVSGLARGCDTNAHLAALSSGLSTIAVIGSGLDHIYPLENKDLSYEIADKDGLILTEYPSSVSPEANHFIMRDRIIAALPKCLVVVEAKDRSGTLVTVSQAMQNGKDILVFPVRTTDTNLINNRLISEGATALDDRQTLEYYLKGE